MTQITRCLKRYVAWEIHRALSRPYELAPRGAELRRLRTVVGLPLRLVAEHLDITLQQLARIERGECGYPELQTRIHTWLTEHNKSPVIWTKQ